MMPAKKKVTKKAAKPTPRISPEVPEMPTDCTIYEDLDDGDAFLLDGGLWMKNDSDDQGAISLDDGEMMYDLCEEVVIPVDIKITWNKK